MENCSVRKALVIICKIQGLNSVDCFSNGCIRSGGHKLRDGKNIRKCFVCTSNNIRSGGHKLRDGKNIRKCFVCTSNNIQWCGFIYPRFAFFVSYPTCNNCRDKKLCFTCFREVSRCKLIHTRKLLCYKFLLSQKFPKDIVRLIAKKVK